MDIMTTMGILTTEKTTKILLNILDQETSTEESNDGVQRSQLDEASCSNQRRRHHHEQQQLNGKFYLNICHFVIKTI